MFLAAAAVNPSAALVLAFVRKGEGGLEGSNKMSLREGHLVLRSEILLRRVVEADAANFH
jgi:hypothetical protein